MPNKEKKKKQYYLVVAGHKPGIYRQWTGDGGAAEQVQGYPGAIYRGFYSLEAAAEWLRSLEETLQTGLPPEMARLLKTRPKESEPAEDPDTIIIYTDGSAIRNPGPGGYGVVLKHKGRRRELSGGEPYTTNNRMELTACIAALRALRKPGKAALYSDSKYVVESINKGWARRWKEKGWLRSGSQPVENQDLWEQLLVLLEKHSVEFHWTRGHAGHPENERCDQLALAAAKKAAAKRAAKN